VFNNISFKTSVTVNHNPNIDLCQPLYRPWETLWEKEEPGMPISEFESILDDIKVDRDAKKAEEAAKRAAQPKATVKVLPHGSVTKITHADAAEWEARTHKVVAIYFAVALLAVIAAWYLQTLHVSDPAT